jgi:hypothetical protein
MDELPAYAARVALAGTIVSEAVTYAAKLAELFDVDVDQFAGVLALMAAHRLG